MQISKEQYFKLPERLQQYFLGQNTHCTVKPLRLMEYLVRLVTPKNGTCLEPFLGSGTTAIACKNLDFNCVGIELSPEYFEIAKARVEYENIKVKISKTQKPLTKTKKKLF